MLLNPVDEVGGCLERDDHLKATLLLHLRNDLSNRAQWVCQKDVPKFAAVPSRSVRKRAQESLADFLTFLGRERLQFLANAGFCEDWHNLPSHTERRRGFLEVSLIPDFDGDTGDKLLELCIFKSLSDTVQVGILATFGADNLPSELERNPLLNRAFVPRILWT